MTTPNTFRPADTGPPWTCELCGRAAAHEIRTIRYEPGATEIVSQFCDEHMPFPTVTPADFVPMRNRVPRTGG